MSQAHGAALWQEPADAGATPAVTPLYLVASGGAYTAMGPDGTMIPCAVAGPDEVVYGVVKRDGTFTPLLVSPIPVAVVGADLVLAAGGVVGAIIADGGGGDLELTADLGRTPIADVYEGFADGARWVSARPLSTLRLSAVLVRGAAHIY